MSFTKTVAQPFFRQPVLHSKSYYLFCLAAFGAMEQAMSANFTVSKWMRYEKEKITHGVDDMKGKLIHRKQNHVCTKL